ncbi:uncharacterized protein LOC121235358 [Juglans microcarpa x Juglans regia]|uniref:uncharacterized protein LOC121235358 n=1 Tax=Juglans microcarpa x Juglans regia TaxID=2249226 RepID=UPI001B7DDAD5|nr:uncharacterized protein LOC121235358 [Juglans microcarpa x Juglans regia]
MLYADDILIFLNGEKRSLRRLVNTLSIYEKWFGQLISKEKSDIYTAKIISATRRRGLVRITGFVEGHFPVIYLGVLLVNGKLKACHLEQLVVKVRSKVAGWKVKLLSQGGRLILLKHVLSSMASHLLVVMDVPKIVIKKINAVLSTFFGGEQSGKAKTK